MNEGKVSKIKLFYLLISLIISFFFYQINSIRSTSYEDHNEFYKNLLNEGNVINPELYLKIPFFNIEVLIDQKFIYFFYENVFKIINLVTEIDIKIIMIILSTFNIFIFCLFIFYKIKLRLIHMICIIFPQLIMLTFNRGMGIYFLSQSLTGRIIEFLKSLFFPLTSNSPFGYEPRSSSALLISLIIIGSAFQFKNRNAIISLVLVFIPIIHYPTSLAAIPIVLVLWRLKILNLFVICFYLLIIGLLSIRLLFSIILVQNMNIVLPFNLIIVGIVLLFYYKLIISKDIETHKITKNSVYSCSSITLLYLVFSLSFAILSFYVDKNNYYSEQYWINNSIRELPARINSFLTIPVYYIISTFIFKSKWKELILKRRSL